MNKFLILRGLWWLVAFLLLVTSLKFFDGNVGLLTILGVLALACWWAVYLLRAWLGLTAAAIYLTISETVPEGLNYCLVGVSVLGVLLLWYEYLVNYWLTQQERRVRQMELLAECQRPRADTQTVLILTASDGFGHLTAAKTWSARLSEGNVVCVDVLLLLPIWLQRVWQSWEYLAVYIPEVHAFVHRFALRSPPWLSKVVVDYLAVRLPLMENVNQVVTTHPLAALAARSLLGRDHVCVRGIHVCTDFFVNPQALNFTFHEVKLPRDLSAGQEQAIPTERDALWRQLILEPHLPTTLILTGGSGLLPAEKIFKLLRWLEKCGGIDRQFLLICGTNERLYVQSKKQLAHVQNVRVVKYVPNISRFFIYFDTVICKAGGLTAAELLNAGTTRIAVWYAFRGQERTNLCFLKNWGAVYVPSFFSTSLSSWLQAAR